MQDEKLIELYMLTGSYAECAKRLPQKITRQAVAQHIHRMRAAGVNIPDLSSRPRDIYTPEHIKKLNELVASYVDKQG